MPSSSSKGAFELLSFTVSTSWKTFTRLASSLKLTLLKLIPSTWAPSNEKPVPPMSVRIKTASRRSASFAGSFSVAVADILCPVKLLQLNTTLLRSAPGAMSLTLSSSSVQMSFAIFSRLSCRKKSW